MATVLSIPITTLQPGTPITIPETPIPTGLTQWSLLIDRHAGANPLLQQSTSTVVTLTVDESDDGGVTWPDTDPNGVASSRIVIQGQGGPDAAPFKGRTSTMLGFSGLMPGDPNNANRRVRASVATTAIVTVSGTLTLS